MAFPCGALPVRAPSPTGARRRCPSIKPLPAVPAPHRPRPSEDDPHADPSFLQCPCFRVTPRRRAADPVLRLRPRCSSRDRTSPSARQRPPSDLLPRERGREAEAHGSFCEATYGDDSVRREPRPRSRIRRAKGRFSRRHSSRHGLWQGHRLRDGVAHRHDHGASLKLLAVERTTMSWRGTSPSTPRNLLRSSSPTSRAAPALRERHGHPSLPR